jgi:hypothetical protein
MVSSKPETLIYRGKNIIGKMFILPIIENSTLKNLSYGINVTWRR